MRNNIGWSRLHVTTSLGMAIAFNVTVASLPGVTVPISWTLSGQSLESVLSEESDYRSQQLACLAEQVQTDLNLGGISHAYKSSLAETGAIEELLNLADIYRQDQQPTEAIQALEKALSLIEPNRDILHNAIALNTIASQYIQLGLLDNARNLLDQALHAVQQATIDQERLVSTDILPSLAKHYRLVGDSEQSLAILAEALSMSASASNEFGSIANHRHFLALVAAEYIQAKEFDHAHEALEQALALDDFYLAVESTFEPALGAYLDVGADAVARAQIDQRQDIEQFLLLQIMAQHYARLNKPEQALAKLNQAMQMAQKLPLIEDPLFMWSYQEWLQFVEQYVEIGYPEVALRQIEKLSERLYAEWSENLQLYLYTAMGQDDRVFYEIESRIGNDSAWIERYVSSRSETLSKIIDLYVKRGQVDNLERLVALGPFQSRDRPEQPYNNERLEVSVALGQAYFAAGHTTKAERVFEDVLDWLPSIEPYLAEQALYLLRDIFTQTMKYGQYDAAIKMLEQYPSELDLNQAYWQSRLMCFIESST